MRGDTGNLPVQPGQGQELPARLLHARKEQVLHDHIRLQLLDAVQIQRLCGDGDAIPLVFQELLHDIEDFLGIVDKQDMGTDRHWSQSLSQWRLQQRLPAREQEPANVFLGHAHSVAKARVRTNARDPRHQWSP